MKHLGDITKINGAEIEPVDVICGGSPCQDLSVAGKRAGLAGSRSSLFMEQMRIVKEMRNARKSDTDDNIRPARFLVWENVDGARSSGTPKGEDFRIVLEEICKVADENASIPRFEGRWPSAGCIMGDGYSVAWRVHDLQYFGCPQRRRRICVCADYEGDTAPKMVFELRRETLESNREQTVMDPGAKSRPQIQAVSESVSGNTQSCEQTGEEIAGDIGECVDPASTAYTLKVRGGREVDSLGHKAGKGALVQKEMRGTLGVSQDQTLFTIGHDERNAQFTTDEKTDPLTASDYKDPIKVCYGLDSLGHKTRENCTHDQQAVLLMDAYQHHGYRVSETCRTLTAEQNQGIRGDTPIVIEDNGSRPSHRGDGYVESETMFTLNSTEHHAVCVGNGQMRNITMKPVVNTLDTMHDQQAVITYGLDRASFNQGINAQYDFSVDEEKIGTQVAKGPGAVCQSVVRRLTPMECERLQNFPDNWTNIGDWVDSKGKTHKCADSQRYKALGNSIGLCWWQWLAQNICSQYPADHQVTMGSLFDGIGGFPLVFSRCGAIPVWASEIEEFPIAVTKKHFPEE